MAHDGNEGLSPTGWLPDRVAVGLLATAFPAELVDRVVEATDTRELRRRLLPARLVVYFVLALWLFRSRNCGYGQVMAKLMDGLWHQCRGDGPLTEPEWRPPNVSSLSRARAKLGPDPLRLLFEQLAGPVGTAGQPGVFCCGLRVISVDDSVADLPATAENGEFFGWLPPGPQDGAFPQVRWVAAAESGTGALTGAAFGPAGVTAQSLVPDLRAAFEPGMLVLAGPGVLGYAPAREVLATGAHICWLASQAGPWQPVRMLSDGSCLAELVPGQPGGGPPVTIRVIDAPAAAPGWPPGRSGLVTDLLDVARYPAAELAGAYQSRWACEAVIGHHRTDMGEGQPVLRSRDPAGAAQEMWALFAVYQALSRLARPPAAALNSHSFDLNAMASVAAASLDRRSNEILAC
jgi:hypothetical protein